MRPSPKPAKRCRLSEGYGHKDAWLPARLVLNDPTETLATGTIYVCRQPIVPRCKACASL